MKTALLSNAFALVMWKLRTQSGLTNRQLSDRSGLSREFISMLENEKRKPSLETLFTLSRAFNIMPTDFIHLINVEANTVENMLQTIEHDG